MFCSESHGRPASTTVINCMSLVISVGNHEVVLPLVSNGKRKKKKVFKSVWNKFEKKNLLLWFLKDESMVPFHFPKNTWVNYNIFAFFSLSRMRLVLFELFLRLPLGNVGLQWHIDYWISAKSLTRGCGAGLAHWDSSLCYHHQSSQSWKRRISL